MEKYYLNINKDSQEEGWILIFDKVLPNGKLAVWSELTNESFELDEWELKEITADEYDRICEELQ